MVITLHYGSIPAFPKSFSIDIYVFVSRLYWALGHLFVKTMTRLNVFVFLFLFFLPKLGCFIFVSFLDLYSTVPGGNVQRALC
jgi:hypothetical protein